MKTSVVIGGAGFIGRHVTRLLCESGREVIVLGRRANVDRELHPSCLYISGDYSDRTVLRRVLKPGVRLLIWRIPPCPRQASRIRF